MVKAIGIDLGSTYTRVAVYMDNCVEMITNEKGNRDTPSCVAFMDGVDLVGDAAMDQALMNTNNTIYGIKRLIGRQFSEPSVQTYIKKSPVIVSPGPGYQPLITVSTSEGERRLAADEICAMLLKRIKANADSFLRCDVKECVMTVPADFTRVQREATANAARRAGIHVMRIITEPASAALAYACDHRETVLASGDNNVLIFDLGGGCLSVSVVSIDRSLVKVKAVAGDSHLGGNDFDARVVEHFAKEVREKHGKDITGSARAMFKLEVVCERAKRALSVSKKTTVEVDALFEGIDFRSTITREVFEKLNEDLLQKCLVSVQRCLEDAKVEKRDIANLVLVGGSTDIPKVQELLKRFFDGKELWKSHVNRDEAVANGAARLAGFLIDDSPDALVLDVVPKSLGVGIAGGKFNILIHRNLTLPVSGKMNFQVFPDKDSCVLISIFEGDSEWTSSNDIVAVYELCDLPLTPKGLHILVCMELDSYSDIQVMAYREDRSRLTLVRRGLPTPLHPITIASPSSSEGSPS